MSCPPNAHTFARRLARWVLLCFALSLGLALASPLAHPQALVCSSAGAVKLRVTAPDASTQVVDQMGDCPLCVTASAPPPTAASPRVEPPSTRSSAQHSNSAAHTVYATAAPLPARGPPRFV